VSFSLTHFSDVQVESTDPQPSNLPVLVVGRKFQPSWQSKYPWIKYSADECKVFCDVCQKYDQLNLFSFSHSKDAAFSTVGYDNWKNTLAKFSKRDSSKSHREAALKVANTTSGTNVASQLSLSLDREREAARTALTCIVSTLHFLCKQGLAVRGHAECRGNFDNLLN